MNKPLTMMVKDTKMKLAQTCNESGLPPIILDLIIQNIYSEIHSIAESQTAEDEKFYFESLTNKDINNDSSNNG
jgi:hypothetical protein